MTRSVRARRSIRPVHPVDTAPDGHAVPQRTAVLVPIKAFADAKQRLRTVLSDTERRLLAQHCAETVLAAAHELAVSVVCDDDGVAEWARAHGAEVVNTPSEGLNPAIAEGVAALAAAGFDMIVVAHGDLPLADDLRPVAATGTDTVTLVPDLVYDGTNVLVLPAGLSGRFGFRYGRGSFAAHLSEALRCGASVRVLRVPALAHDIDTPDDFDRPEMEGIRQWLRTNPDNPR